VIAAEARVKHGIDVVRSDDGAKWAFVLAIGGAIVAYYFAARHQWFVRDDYALVLTRQRVLEISGWQHWLFDPQDGHWLTVPVLVYHVTENLFGLDSYWPFLVPTLLSHIAAVLLVRILCRRNGVSAWTTTLVCSLLLVFGAGWENMVFAIQITFNFSLVAFLAQLVLTDHDGPVDRRDWIAVGISIIGVMSSGFGPIFMVGIFVLLAVRRRWKALVIAVGPQAVLYGWWYVFWEKDPASDSHPGNLSHLPAFVAKGVGTTFDSLVSLSGLGGIALVATLAVALSARFGPRTRSMFVALTATTLVMFLAIGVERVGFGLSIASSSRYLHIAGILLAPIFALAIDQLARISREARWAGLAVVSASTLLNLGVLHELSIDWATDARAQKDTLDLIAGSGLAPQADPNRSIFLDSPDVRVLSIPVLIEQGAVHPRPPITPEEIQRVRDALGLPPTP
jgi:hypothetical protein